MQLISQLILANNRPSYQDIIAALNFLDVRLPNNSRDPDVLLLGEQSTSIKIKDTRDLIEWAGKKTFQSEYKVGIVFNAENLTMEAQNAILKVLEEPPQNTLLVLTTNNITKLLPTIRSRVNIVSLHGSDRKYDTEIVDKFLKLDLVTKRSQLEKLIKEDKQTQLEFLYNFCTHVNKNLTHYNNPAEIIESLLMCVKGIKRNANSKLIFTNLLTSLEAEQCKIL